MPRVLKIALGLLAVFLLVCIVAGVAAKHWLGKARDDLLAEGRQQQVEARAWGAGRPGTDCVPESHRRNAACGDFMCEVRSGLFLRFCLDAARPAPSLCEGVPSRTEIMSSARWAIARCEADGRPNDPKCQRLMQRLQEYCRPTR